MRINTVTGLVELDDTSVVLPHEHAMINYGQMIGIESVAGQETQRRLLTMFKKLSSCGVSVVVDCTPPGYGRDIEILRNLSEESGVHIVASTGTFCEQWHRLPNWVYELSVSELAAHFVLELGDFCGSIKVATSHGVMHPTEEKAFEAAVIAHRETGAPIVAHTTGSLGVEQVEFLTVRGVDPAKILVSHVCAADEPIAYAIDIARRGAFVGFDRIGHASHPDSYWLDLVEEIDRAGLFSQVLISHDSVQFFEGPDEIRGHTFSDPAHIFTSFSSAWETRPQLAGRLSELLTTNPHKWLTR
jgi:phosphotriesterase-related protein